MGQDLCKINKHFLQFPIKASHYSVDCLTYDRLIYHQNLSDFFPQYFNTCLGNTLLVDDTPYRTCLNLPFNAIFIESSEYMLKEDNYLMKTFLSYLEFLHNYGLSVPPLWSSILLVPLYVLRKAILDSRRYSKNIPWLILLIFVEIILNLQEVVQIFYFVPSLQFFWGFSNLIDLYCYFIFGLSQLLFVYFFQIIDVLFFKEVEDKELPNSHAIDEIPSTLGLDS